jgi:hemerythrin
MARFVLTEQFVVGIPVIDQQHLQLVEHINQVIDAYSGGLSHKTIGHLIDKMVDHAIFHFGFEEQLQELSGYPFLKAHQKSHVQFAKRISDFQTRFNNGDDISEYINGLLVEWLSDHLKHDDSDYVALAKEYLLKHPEFLTQKKTIFGRLFG